MKLFELAYACRLYGQLAAFDRPLDDLWHVAGPLLDPMRPEHRVALFKWLNAWGCRQFSIAHHSSTASDSLVEWSSAWLAKLPAQRTDLTELTPDVLDVSAAAYERLRDARASWRTLPGGRSSSVRFGPTGAAKTLFALRPETFPPWDDPIRVKLGFGADVTGFRAYLQWVATTLRTVADEAGVPVGALPDLLGRPLSSPPKLIDEYNWVVITRSCVPPTLDELARWTDWASNDDGLPDMVQSAKEPLSERGRA